MRERLKRLNQRANLIRQDVICSLEEARSGHSGGSLGMADIFTALYFGVLNYNPKEPNWIERDRLLLSAGHLCPVLYATMAEAGFFERKELLTLRKMGSRLQGHPHNLELPGIEVSSGPLGQGLSQAVGMALAAKLDGLDSKIYCVLSDGEHDEGQVWEALMLASAKELNNLIVVLDRNFIQLEGPTEKIMPLEPFKAKYEAFGWEVRVIDGNDMEQILDAFEAAKQAIKPFCIMANTILGKGVSFMEGNHLWHGKVPNKEQADQALEQLIGFGGVNE